jgi:hypothetical protein
VRTRAATVGIALVVTGAMGVGGCRERQAKPLIQHAAVVRCERGVQEAGEQPDIDKATAIYYRACADIHAAPACRDAFLEAAKLPVDKQLNTAIAGCTKAYCQTLGADRFEICKPGFQLTPVGITRAWPPFHAAVIDHDAKGLARRVNNALLTFYIKTQALLKANAEKAKDAKEQPADAGTDARPIQAAGEAPSAPSGAPAVPAAPSPVPAASR